MSIPRLFFSLAVLLSLGSQSSLAQTKDGFFSQAFPEDKDQHCYNNPCTKAQNVLIGEALYSIVAFASWLGGMGKGQGVLWAYEKAADHLNSAKAALISEAEREAAIAKVVNDRTNYTITKKGAELTSEAKEKVQELKTAPLVVEASKAQMIEQAEAKVRDAEATAVKKLKSMGIKAQKLFLVSGAVAAVDMTTQIVLVFAVGRYGNPSPILGLTNQGLKELSELLRSQDEYYKNLHGKTEQ